MAIQSIGSLIKEEQAGIKRAQLRLRNIKEVRSNLQDDRKVAQHVIGAGTRAYAYISDTNLRVTACTVVESFKEDRKLTAMLTRAVEADLYALPSCDYVADWIAERTFKFQLPNGGTLAIEARLKGDGSATCRKVQTGVKTVQEATFEIVCD